MRRCWRFGQQRPVDVHVFASQRKARSANLRRKEADAGDGRRDGRRNARRCAKTSSGRNQRDTNPYHATARMRVPISWRPFDANALAIVL